MERDIYMKKPAVYTVKHLVSGKIYVGWTSEEINKYWAKHCSNSKYSNSRYFYRALRKYGKDAFDWSIFQEYENKELAKQGEIDLIAYYKSQNIELYNMTNGGDGRSGYVMSDETKQKISQSHIGIRHTEETKKKISDNLKGKISQKKGIPNSEEVRKKISIANKGRQSPNKGNFLIDDNLLKIIVYENTNGVSKVKLAIKYGVSRQTIYNSLKRAVNV